MMNIIGSLWRDARVHISLWLILSGGFLLLMSTVKAAAGPALLFEPETGKVLYSAEPDRPSHPASLNQLMTAYLVYEEIREGRLKLTDAILQSEEAIKEPPPKIGYPVGIGMSAELALQSIIVMSANDVATMFGEKISGSKEAFLKKMNAKAKTLGMKNTLYTSPWGAYNEQQVTSARDMAILTAALFKDFPEHTIRYGRKKMRIGKKTLKSPNDMLLTYNGADGVQSSFACEAGHNLVASATRNDKKLVVIILASESEQEGWRRAGELLDYGFKTLKKNGKNSFPKLNDLPVGPFAAAKPVNMSAIACSKKGKKKKEKPKTKKRKKVLEFVGDSFEFKLGRNTKAFNPATNRKKAILRGFSPLAKNSNGEEPKLDEVLFIRGIYKSIGQKRNILSLKSNDLPKAGASHALALIEKKHGENFPVLLYDPASELDKTKMLVLAREVGRHVCHQTITRSSRRNHKMTVEVDRFAGMVMRMISEDDDLGVVLELARGLYPEDGDKYSPGLNKRLEAITYGWEKAPACWNKPKPKPVVNAQPKTKTASNRADKLWLHRKSDQWLHRGSVLKMVRKGASRRFVYETPARDAALLGAKKGGLRFKGRKSGNTYSGTAYFHSKKCGQKTYKASGRVSSDGERVTLSGKAPSLNRKCRVVGRKTITLIFNLLPDKEQVTQPALARQETSGKVWRHNGSTMTLVRNKSERRFLYKSPSNVADKLGATFGKLRFKGTKKGRTYRGTAYDYAGKCKRVGYRVSGKISSDGRRVTMRGKAPRRNKKCRVVAHRSVVLIFDKK